METQEGKTEDIRYLETPEMNRPLNIQSRVQSPSGPLYASFYRLLWLAPDEFLSASKHESLQY